MPAVGRRGYYWLSYRIKMPAMGRRAYYCLSYSIKMPAVGRRSWNPIHEANSTLPGNLSTGHPTPTPAVWLPQEDFPSRCFWIYCQHWHGDGSLSAVLLPVCYLLTVLSILLTMYVVILLLGSREHGYCRSFSMENKHKGKEYEVQTQRKSRLRDLAFNFWERGLSRPSTSHWLSRCSPTKLSAKS